MINKKSLMKKQNKKKGKKKQSELENKNKSWRWDKFCDEGRTVKSHLKDDSTKQNVKTYISLSASQIWTFLPQRSIAYSSRRNNNKHYLKLLFLEI